jgi:peptide/nickel transport system substrate-binding protein
MRKRSIWLAASLAIIASLVVGPGATAGTERAQAGTVVFIHDQEPPTLRNNWTDNNLYATGLIMNRVFQGCEKRDAKGNLVPDLCTAKPRIVKRNPLTVTFTFKPNATWSDGRQVTGADFRATWQVFINPKFNVVSRTGWEDMRSVTARGKTVTIVFKKPIADWESYAASSVYPAHIIAGKDMNQMFNDSVPVSNGPWKFGSWQRGVQLTLLKNTAYKAGPAMKLDRVVFRYILDTNARFQALKAGEGQMMEPQPQLQIAEFLKDSKFNVQRQISQAFEHIDIQFGAKGHPALKQKYVREALVRGMNRPQVANALYSTISPGLPALQSLIFKPFESNYQKTWAKYPFNQQSVINLLRSKGCTGGPARPSASNNNIFSCPNVGKLSFRFFTTTGNQLRALTFEIIQRQLKSVGIELVPRFQTGGVLFGTTLPSSDWDLIMFTYLQTPDSKITSKDLYACGGDQNYGLYCNRKLTAILNRVPTTLEQGPREKLLNEAEARYISTDIASIPMYARPAFVIHNKSVKGPVLNPTLEGSTWNVNSWTAS